MIERRLALKIIGAAVALVLAIIALCNVRINYVAKGRIYTDPALIRAQNVAVIMDYPPRSPFYIGRWIYIPGLESNSRTVFPNPYHVAQIKAGAQLYHSGHVRFFIVSGTPAQAPEMKADLIAAGVPADKITCDSRGYRTLESIIRARDTFGQRSFTIVSQPNHCARVIYLADAYGIDVVGFAAEDPRYSKDGRYGIFVDKRTLHVMTREFFARAKAMLDVHILYRHPKFPGEGTPIPDNIDPNGRGG